MTGLLDVLSNHSTLVTVTTVIGVIARSALAHLTKHGYGLRLRSPRFYLDLGPRPRRRRRPRSLPAPNSYAPTRTNLLD